MCVQQHCCPTHSLPLFNHPPTFAGPSAVTDIAAATAATATAAASPPASATAPVLLGDSTRSPLHRAWWEGFMCQRFVSESEGKSVCK